MLLSSHCASLHDPEFRSHWFFFFFGCAYILGFWKDSLYPLLGLTSVILIYGLYPCLHWNVYIKYFAHVFSIYMPSFFFFFYCILHTFVTASDSTDVAELNVSSVLWCKIVLQCDNH